MTIQYREEELAGDAPLSGKRPQQAQEQSVQFQTDAFAGSAPDGPISNQYEDVMALFYSKNAFIQTLREDFSAAFTDMKQVRLDAGEVLWRPGDRIERAYFLENGLVSAQATFETGRQVECLLAGRNTVIGALGVIGLDVAVTHHVNLFDCDAWVMPVETLRAAAARSRTFESTLKSCCRAQLAFGIGVGACNAVHPAHQRLARWLLLADDLMDGAWLPLNQEELGATVAMHRTAVNPTLQRWQSRQLISTRRGKVTIVDRERLKAEACPCYETLTRCARVLAHGAGDAG